MPGSAGIPALTPVAENPRLRGALSADGRHNGSMSMLFGPTSSDPSVSGLPRGEVLGSYPTYLEARKVVDELAGQEFDVRTVSIVGTDLRTVERIRNRLTYPSVALRSAIQGAFFGLMLGILMTLIDPAGSGVQILYTVGLGVAVWVIFGVIGHAMRKGRGVNSVQQLVPSNFDVVCEFETAAQARQALGRPVAARPPAPTPPPAQPQDLQQGTTPAPERPAGSPPDAPAPSAEQAPSPAPAPAPASTPAPSAAQPAEQAPPSAPARTGVFPDLPDGRPQFGVRLPEGEARELQERILRENAARNAPAGEAGAGSGSFEAPAYGKGGKGTSASSAAPGRRSDPDRPVDGGAAPGSDAPGLAEPPAEGERPASDTGAGAEAGTTAEGHTRPRYGRRAAPVPEDSSESRDATGEPGDRA
ncbi:hypothetical protein F7P69_16330 [Cellulosimicrobium funkei]|nr:hypothetical protein [Cellulosimicrobium funkei]